LQARNQIVGLRPWLGLVVDLKSTATLGLQVLSVRPGGPAHDAGASLRTSPSCAPGAVRHVGGMLWPARRRKFGVHRHQAMRVLADIRWCQGAQRDFGTIL
jgi:hypothetical protein